jgi:putative DNA primase/helicase
LSTFGLAVQPSIIEDLASGSKKKFRGNGCLARFLYSVPASNVGSRDLTKRIQISEEAEKAYATGIRSLLDIPAAVSGKTERSRVLRLDHEGRRSWIAFQQALESRLALGDLSAIPDWAAKLSGAVLRLAGLSHIAEHGTEDTTISRLTVERTLDLADLLIKHALCAFSLMGADQATSDAKYVMEWLRKNRKLTVRQNEIYRGCHGKIARIDRLQKALTVLIERHIISDAIVEKTGGRPSIQFCVNPELLGGDQ